MRLYADVLKRNILELETNIRKSHRRKAVNGKAYAALAIMIKTACFVHDQITLGLPASGAAGWRMKGVG